MSEPIQSIAQNNYILATQKEVSHDNTLSGNGTVDSPLGVVPDYNETVLYKFTGSDILETSAYNLSEAYTNFNRMRITFVYNDGYSICQEYDTKHDATRISAPIGITPTTNGNIYCKIGGFTHNNEHTQISRTSSYDITNFTGMNVANVISIDSVVGINRISGNA